MNFSHNSTSATPESHISQAIMLETNLDPWHRRMESFMAQGAKIIAFRGAGSANGIEPVAAAGISAHLRNRIVDMAADGTPVVLMYDGDSDRRERPALGSVFGTLVDELADNAGVTAMAVQTSKWYKPKREDGALASATGRPYETYVFNEHMSDIDASLQGRGLAHSALTQSRALVAYPSYEQIIVGPAGPVAASQLHDLAKSAALRPPGLGPVNVTVIAARVNPALHEMLQESAGSHPDEIWKARAAEKIAQRASHPYGTLFTITGEFALSPSDYPNVSFRPFIVE